MNKQEITVMLSKFYQQLLSEHNENSRKSIYFSSPYSADINNFISSAKELSFYLNLNLSETYVTRPAITMHIVPDFITPNGKSNLSLMLHGNPPFDASTGEVIQLHHIGQKYDSPFAELPRLFHIGFPYYGILHDSSVCSWRQNNNLIELTNKEISQYWRMRGEMI